MNDEVFIIGGESIYELFLPYADNLYLTEIDGSHEADTYFPYFDKELYEREIIKSDCYNNVNYSFVLYKRIK
jgi:dihydrofolate reductase